MTRPKLLWGGENRPDLSGGDGVKKSHIILTAGVVYLVIMVVGGAIYYAYRQRPMAAPAEESSVAAVKAPSAEEQAAAKAAAAEEEKAKQREKRIDELKAALKTETIHGITYYRYDWPQRMPTGVYLRPFVAVGNGRCVLKNDVCYAYSIDDPQQTAWINGDRLDILAGGQRTTLSFDPKTMHKQMAPDASWLMENYVTEADPDALAALHRVAAASNAELVYYKSDGKSRQQMLSAEEIERVRVMVELYELLAAE